MRLKRRGSFMAKGNDGQTYTVHMYVKVLDIPHFEDADAKMEGLGRLKTDEGYTVNYLSRGSYEIMETGVKLTSNAPNAP